MARGSRRDRDTRSQRHDASDADLTRAQGDPLADEMRDQPFDLAAVQRDDALIDALSGGGTVPTTSAEEYRLATLLAGWRAEIVEPDLPAGPTLDEVAAAVDAELARSREPRRPALRLLRPVAGAAAAIAVVMAGATVFSYNAEPGDPLWRIKEVVFTERANSTVASIDTTNNLQEAERRMRAGDARGAMAELESASQRVGAIHDADKRDELNAWRDRLMADVTQATTALPVPPVAPPASGVTTTPPLTPESTLPIPGPTTVPSVPSDILTAPVQPTLPPVTQLPSVTGLPIPPVTTAPSPEILGTSPDSGSVATTTPSAPVTPSASDRAPSSPTG